MVLAKSSAIPTNPSAQVQVVLKWMESMTEGDLDGLASTLADDYTHVVLPASTGVAVHNGKESYLASVKEVMSMFTGNTATILEIIEVPGVVVLHESSDGKTKFGVDYKNEAIMTYYLEPAGEGKYKVAKVKAFVDSKFTAGFAEEVQKVLASSAK